MDYPPDFRCPISMELMSDPVTIATGVTYERKNIEKWFHQYKKPTCPATMQRIQNLDITPNHTLKRLILAWSPSPDPNNAISSPARPSTSSSPARPDTEEILSLLAAVESSPFKVTALKKLRAIVAANAEEAGAAVVRAGGAEILVGTMVQVLAADGSEFGSFRGCEEALGVVQLLPVKENRVLETLLKPEAVKAIAVMLQRGSSESRLHAVTVFREMARINGGSSFGLVVQDYGGDLFKSMLELASDEICTKASSRALDVLGDTLGASKKNRLNAIESGAVRVLIDLLPDSTRHRCEKILAILKLLSECAEGRAAITEHGMGIAAVSKKLLLVSNAATKLGVKILWHICGCNAAAERVAEEMVAYGAVKKLVALLHMDGRSSTKDKVVQMFKLHGNTWKKYSCFPSELKGYLGYSINY